MKFSSQDAAETLLSLSFDRDLGLKLGMHQRLRLGLSFALGVPEAGASVYDSDLDWVSDSKPIVFLNTYNYEKSDFVGNKQIFHRDCM